MITGILCYLFGLLVLGPAMLRLHPNLKKWIRYAQRRVFRRIEWKIQFHMAHHLGLLVENTALKLGIACEIRVKGLKKSATGFWQVDNLHWVEIGFPADPQHVMVYMMSVHEPYSAERIEQILWGGMDAARKADNTPQQGPPHGAVADYDDDDWWRGN